MRIPDSTMQQLRAIARELAEAIPGAEQEEAVRAFLCVCADAGVAVDDAGELVEKKNR